MKIKFDNFHDSLWEIPVPVPINIQVSKQNVSEAQTITQPCVVHTVTSADSDVVSATVDDRQCQTVTDSLSDTPY